jgi:hypothetical protein
MSNHGYTVVLDGVRELYRYRFKKAIDKSVFECYVSFRYMPALEAYDVIVGVEDPFVRRNVEAALGTIVKDTRTVEIMEKLFASVPCLCNFNVDAFDVLQDGMLRSRDRDSLTHQINALFEKVIEPIFESVTTYEKLFEMLIRNDGAFAWRRSLGSARLAEIVCLAIVTKQHWPPIYKRIKDTPSFLKNDTIARAVGDSFVDQLHEYFENSVN